MFFKTIIACMLALPTTGDICLNCWLYKIVLVYKKNTCPKVLSKCLCAIIYVILQMTLSFSKWMIIIFKRKIKRRYPFVYLTQHLNNNLHHLTTTKYQVSTLQNFFKYNLSRQDYEVRGKWLNKTLEAQVREKNLSTTYL